MDSRTHVAAALTIASLPLVACGSSPASSTHSPPGAATSAAVPLAVHRTSAQLQSALLAGSELPAGFHEAPAPAPGTKASGSGAACGDLQKFFGGDHTPGALADVHQHLTATGNGTADVEIDSFGTAAAASALLSRLTRDLRGCREIDFVAADVRVRCSLKVTGSSATALAFSMGPVTPKSCTNGHLTAEVVADILISTNTYGDSLEDTLAQRTVAKAKRVLKLAAN